MNNVAVYLGLITAKLVWARNQESKRAEILGARSVIADFLLVFSRANFFVFDYLGAHNYPVYIFLSVSYLQPGIFEK